MTNYIGEKYIELLPTNEKTIELMREVSKREQEERRAIVIGETLLKKNKFVATDKSYPYSKLVRGVITEYRDGSNEFTSRTYFNVPIPYKNINGEEFYICPINPNLAVSNKGILDINTDERIKVFHHRYKFNKMYPTIYYGGITIFIHVLKAYSILQVPKNIEHRYIVDHKDGNVENHDINNLRFLTPSANSIGQGNMNNDGKGIEIEVYDFIEKKAVRKYYSLRKFLTDMKFDAPNVDGIFNTLSKGLYKDRYVWRTDPNEKWEDVLKRCAKVWFEVYRDDELIETCYSIKEVSEKYSDRPLHFAKRSREEVLLNILKCNPNLMFKASDKYERVSSDEGYEVYNPITKDRQYGRTLRELSKTMGWTGPICGNMFKKGNTYVNANGYICAKKGDIQTPTNYAIGLNKHFYKGEEYSSVREIANMNDLDRRFVPNNPDYKLVKYPIETLQ